MSDMVYSFDWSGAGNHSDPRDNITCYGGHPGPNTVPAIELPEEGVTDSSPKPIKL